MSKTKPRDCLACGRRYQPKQGNKGHCSLPCQFWAKVAIGGPDDCWPFMGCRSTRGYGNIGFDSENYKSHRIAVYLTTGTMPVCEAVRHSCDNPPCCNPAHLLEGTQKENSADCLARGRANSPVGARNSHAKLDEHAVRLIRADARACVTLASEFGVSKASIYKARLRQTWASVSPLPLA